MSPNRTWYADRRIVVLGGALPFAVLVAGFADAVNLEEGPRRIAVAVLAAAFVAVAVPWCLGSAARRRVEAAITPDTHRPDDQPAAPGDGHRRVVAPLDMTALRQPKPGETSCGPQPEGDNVTLSRDETRIVTLLANGSGIADIAEELAIPPAIVGLCLEKIQQRMGVATRSELVATARRQGLVRGQGFVRASAARRRRI